MQTLQDKNEPPMFTFIDYLQNNRAYQEALENLNACLLKFVESHQERLVTFEPFIKLYREYSPTKPMPELLFHDVEDTIQDLLKSQDFVERLEDGEFIIFGFVSNIQLKNELLGRLKTYR